MRTIKFRAWDKKEKKIIGWNILKEQIWNIIAIQENRNSNWELMQFTGLKDKNGKEIYEGDITRFYLGSDKKGSITSVVEWDEYNARWMPKNWMPAPFSKTNASLVEVIGNIYENPELLK